ncbi:Uncharacterized conserved protein, DUF58 family, contains vWF domain [Thiothrix caldifontis]|uniref:Uncharacterized conserved protein, DUF58 family, contains vWF domain n=1 Tax=Thiothrix caldifontis TaxID=525918 RepID=A0A1H4A059_9GAMM|nr:DUF58 domain-containing protein [Thiothrix caldifontis]SEA29523.1 Uncharacterized conserved protein, DUF58 family, contains vWF domain [Thiothrix caldifontis]
MILPARRSFQLVGVNAVIALFASIFPDLIGVWYVTVGISLLLAFADLLLVVTEPVPRAERFVPHSLPLGVKRTVQLRIHNTSKRSLTLDVFDHFPLEVSTQSFPLRLGLAVGKFAEPLYEITANERGKLHFPCLQLRILSPLQLWWHDVKLPIASATKVYPNFAAVAQYALMATDHHLSHMGIMKKRRRGEGQDFHQLREYRAGDSLRQIDWKASSRMRKPISREYQDERDQEIIFLLDCGHRMLAKDDELSHFDHTLNAILLLTYVALRQGDAVGLGSFAGQNRWLPAHKGQHNVQHMLNALYDLQPTTHAPDYAQAATELLVRQKKRALIVLLTNLRDEDLDDLLPALHILRKRHLVLLASMREQAIDQALNAPVDNLEDALHTAAVQHYLATREATLNRVRAAGIRCLDVPPAELSVNLINHYLDIKRSGLL